MFRSAPKGVFIIFLVCVIFFIVFAGAFIAGEFGHDCCDEDCSVCLQIELVENLLKCFSLLVLFVCATALVFRAFGPIKRAGGLRSYRLTPVALKVRLNS
jgi:hypothetical protein